MIKIKMAIKMSNGWVCGEMEQTYLPLSHLLEALKHLLCRVRILGERNHELDKPLEINFSLVPADLVENTVHLAIIIHKPKARQCGRELDLVQGVTPVPVEVAEHGLEFLQLNGGQIRHVARHELVIEKSQLLLDGSFDQGQLVRELVVRVRREVVLLDVGFRALLVDGGNGLQELV